MFCDLVGSTSLAAKLDAEGLAQTSSSAYLDEASTAVTGFGGHVLKKLGDGLMALFGYPQAQENDAERAVRAALAILRALEELNARNAGSGLPALAARIGLESGPVVVDATGEVFGEAPNVAARVQERRRAGDRSRHRGRAAADRGPVRRRGQGRARTEGRAGASRSSTASCARAAAAGAAGRARSRRSSAARKTCRARSAAGSARAAARVSSSQIVGEPGLGKSRLIEEFRARLGETPHTWVEWASSQLVAEHAAASRSPNGAACVSAAPRSPAKSASPNSSRRSRR